MHALLRLAGCFRKESKKREEASTTRPGSRYEVAAMKPLVFTSAVCEDRMRKRALQLHQERLSVSWHPARLSAVSLLPFLEAF